MKSFLTTLCLVITMSGFAQNNEEEKAKEQVKTPKIVSLLATGKSVKEDNIEVKFIEVVEDSRCPEDVTCIWAGEVKVKVAVTNHNAAKPTPKEKLLVLSPSAEFDNLFGNIFHADGFNITAINVKPYPVSTKKIKPEEYALQFHVQR